LARCPQSYDCTPEGKCKCADDKVDLGNYCYPITASTTYYTYNGCGSETLDTVIVRLPSQASQSATGYYSTRENINGALYNVLDYPNDSVSFFFKDRHFNTRLQKDLFAHFYGKIDTVAGKITGKLKWRESPFDNIPFLDSCDVTYVRK
jgi:hypothetical protein